MGCNSLKTKIFFVFYLKKFEYLKLSKSIEETIEK